MIMIDYSIAIRKTHPGDRQSTETKAYGVAQLSDIVTLEQFAEHIAVHGSIFTKDIIHGVLVKMVDCMKEMLLEGKKVQLGYLGSFAPSLSTEGARTAALFTAENIKKVRVNWSPGAMFKNLRKEATFNLVPSREAQAEAVAEAKLQETHA